MEETIILDNKLIVEIEESQEGFEFHSSIESELLASEAEITQINEDLESLNRLDARCDQLDYSLAVTSGAICGIIDIFLVRSAENSFLSPLTDRWFESQVMDFARLNNWDGDSIKSAVRFLEKSFKVNYDQCGAGDARSVVYDLTPINLTSSH